MHVTIDSISPHPAWIPIITAVPSPSRRGVCHPIVYPHSSEHSESSCKIHTLSKSLNEQTCHTCLVLAVACEKNVQQKCNRIMFPFTFNFPFLSIFDNFFGDQNVWCSKKKSENKVRQTIWMPANTESHYLMILKRLTELIGLGLESTPFPCGWLHVVTHVLIITE